MKATLLLPAIVLATCLQWVSAETPLPTTEDMPAGVTGGYETLQSKVIKVYSAEDRGARHRAYVVTWKGREVIVNDPLGRTDKKVGEDITFIAQRVEVPLGEENIKLLQFTIMEF